MERQRYIIFSSFQVDWVNEEMSVVTLFNNASNASVCLDTVPCAPTEDLQQLRSDLAEWKLISSLMFLYEYISVDI